MTKEELIKENKKLKQDVKHWRNMFYELAEPIDEYENEYYLVRREAFVSSFDGKINYGYSVYKWNGEYDEMPLTPTSKETFKFKKWKEIFHTHSEKKTNCSEMLDIALRYIGVIGVDYVGDK